MKQLLGIYKAPNSHWVGNGFNVRSLFTYNNHGKFLNPFLLLDRAGPTKFEPTTQPRGVGEHPHRGFETVTIVYDGEVAHHDSTGQGGVIGVGDVQWMTAASGILHQEYHSEKFTKQGGTLDMVQLWVNLPAKDKMTQPSYQLLSEDDIPVFMLEEDQGFVRVIAGNYLGHKGAARTFSPLDVWDVQLMPSSNITLPVRSDRHVGLVIVHGKVLLNGETELNASDLAILDVGGENITLSAMEQSTILYLSGEAIDEPIAGHGPFVMNTREEIIQASKDYTEGRFGKI